MIFSSLSLAALLGIAALALFPSPQLLPPDKMLGDKLALLFLLVVFALANIPKLRAKATENRDAVTFGAFCAWAILFHLAQRMGPLEGASLGFPFAPDEKIVVPFATFLAIFGALAGAPIWWKNGGAFERFFVAGSAFLGVFAWAFLLWMGNYYAIGFDKTLDPSPVAALLLGLISYASLALCVRAATATEALRGAMLRIVPAILLVVWARHQFLPIEMPNEDLEDGS